MSVHRVPRTYARTFKTIGTVTGVGAIARAALEGEQAVINSLVRKARQIGVSEKDIARGLALKKKHDRAVSLAAIVFPWIPNPVLLRLLAGKPIDDLVKTTPERSRRAKH
jgi:hypothetical protein